MSLTKGMHFHNHENNTRLKLTTDRLWDCRRTVGPSGLWGILVVETQPDGLGYLNGWPFGPEGWPFGQEDRMVRQATIQPMNRILLEPVGPRWHLARARTLQLTIDNYGRRLPAQAGQQFK